MHVLILGAAGMVGRKLTERLLKDGRLGNREISGMTLQDVVVTATSLEVKIAPKGDFKFTTQFIGQDGKVLATDRSMTPRYTLRGSERYVRAKVRIPAGLSWTNIQAVEPDFVREGSR